MGVARGIHYFQFGLANINEQNSVLNFHADPGGCLKQICQPAHPVRFAHDWQALRQGLEAEVAECLVRFCHTVNFITLFHGAATAFGGFHQLIGQTQRHRLLTTLFSGFF